MRPVSLATPFSLYLTLASGRANHSANHQIAVPYSATTNLPSPTTNASFSAGPFSFIIPYGQSQQCNIFGPICQTGLITVGVSLASSTTTTTLPCSSYLTAQAAHLLSGKLESGGHITLQDAREWLTAFGRSPECRSYARVHQNEAQYTFSDCGTGNTIIQASEGFSLPTQIPPAVFDRFRPLDYACCGNCTLIIPEVRLFYFPDQVAPQCANQPSNSSATVSARAINKRVQSLNNTGSIAVLSGHTFTSPSVYLQVVGTAAIRDECGSFGPILTNPIITLPPNVLSTYVPPTYAIGSTYIDPNVQNGPDGFVGHAEPLNIADLQCPTFGLGIGTSADGSAYTTVGPPWLPIIIPPREVFTLDPMWESICTELASYYVFESFAIFDPPFALAPESYLVAPLPATSSPQLKGPPNTPANPTAAPDPRATYLPDLSDPPSSPAESIAPSVGNSLPPQAPPVNAAQPAAVPLDPAAKQTAAPETPVNAAQPTAVPLDQGAETIAAPETPVNAAQPAAVPLDPAAKAIAAPDSPTKSLLELQEGDSVQSGSLSLAPFISSAFGQGDSQSSGSGGKADPTHIIPVPGSGIVEVTVGGQVLSISPSGVYLSGTSYSPEGPAITLSGGVFSLVTTFPTQEASTPDEDPPMDDQPFTPSIQTIAGHNVISNTSGVYVGDSNLSPGGSAITASHTMISLSPAGTLVIGSSSIALSLANTRETPPAKLNLNGVTIQAEPSAAVIDGITLRPGGPGTEIDGTSIDLEQDGILVVGTSHLVLPTAQEPTPSVLSLDGMAVQLDSSAVLVDGTALTPGGPSVSINGNRVSLGRDRSLDIGTGHFALPAAAQATTPPNGFKLNGLTVQARPSAVVVNGVTLTPGEPGTTIDGSSVSLEPSGTLDIGTGRFAIPTGPVNGTSILQTFEGAQDTARRPPRLLYVAAIIVPGLWMVVS